MQVDFIIIVLKRIVSCAFFAAILCSSSIAQAQSVQELGARPPVEWTLFVEDGPLPDPTQPISFPSEMLACPSGPGPLFFGDPAGAGPAYWRDCPRYSAGQAYGYVGIKAGCVNGGDPFTVDGSLLCPYIDSNGQPIEEPGECEPCKPGQSPLAQGPAPVVGNPISVESGAKVQSETDYATADGLLSVVRSYRSRQGAGEDIVLPGFGAMWHGLLPGELIASGNAYEKLTLQAADGTKTVFSAPADTASWVYSSADSTRIAVANLTDLSVPRSGFFEGVGDASTRTGEIRLSLKNGDYILFQRIEPFSPATGTRRLSPVEYGWANGYRQFFDYSGVDPFPYRIRDTFGRQLALTWSAIEWSNTNEPQAAKGKKLSEIALPDGTRLAYSYDNAVDSTGEGWGDRLVQVRRLDSAGAVMWGRSYHYEDARFVHALTGVSDQVGNRLATYTYHASGYAASTEQAGGVNRWEVKYLRDPASPHIDIRAVTNPLGREERYTFELPSVAGGNAPRKLLSISGSATSTVPADARTFSYANGLLTSSTDANGNTTNQSVDQANKRPDSTIAANGVARQITWHPTLDLPTQVLLPNRLAVLFSYDPNGQLLSRDEVDQTPENGGATRTTTFTWAAGGRLLSVNGPRNPMFFNGVDDITTFTYDAAGNRTSMTNALGHVTSYSGYDGNGNPGEMTDPNGIKTTFTYDGLGRVKAITIKHPTDPEKDATTSLEYDIEGRVTKLTRPQTASLLFQYDLAGRLISTRSEDGERIDYTYDAMNNVLSETVKGSDGVQARAITRTFDSLGRLLTATLGPQRTTQWAYDFNGNATQVTTPRGNVTTRAFDAVDRLVSVMAPAAGTSVTTYDSQDNPTSFADPKQVVTEFVRNGFGEVVQEVSPDRGIATFVYNRAGDIEQSTDARGITVYYGHDVLGRLTYKEPSDNAANAVHYDWDALDTETTYRIGRLTRIRDSSGVMVFNYDHRGNLISQRQRAANGTEWLTLRYGYDLADRVTLVTYPSGRQVQYVRDEKGRVRTIRTRKDLAVTSWTNLATGISYEPFGPVKAMTLGNGLRSVTDWGNDGRLASRRLFKSADGSNLSRLSYAYDADDNIVRINDLVDPAKTQKYAYDAAGRVSRIDTASGAIQRTSYTYDENGNRLRESRRALPTDPSPLESDAYTYEAGTNRLVRVKTGSGPTAPLRTFAYDDRGNTAAESRPGGVTVTTAYDGYGRLTQYNRSNVDAFAFAYNGRDDRVTMVRGIDTRRFVYDPEGRVLGEYGNSAADVKAEFIWASPEVANDNAFGGSDGTAGYAPLAVATPDLTGTIQINWIHGNHLGVPLVTTDSAGNPAATPNDYFAPGFPGQSRILPDLYYNRYRDYDPTTGRYIQADPIGLGGGSNNYGYAGGNPVGRVDPLGLDPVTILIWDTESYRGKGSVGHAMIVQPGDWENVHVNVWPTDLSHADRNGTVDPFERLDTSHPRFDETVDKERQGPDRSITVEVPDMDGFHKAISDVYADKKYRAPALREGETNCTDAVVRALRGGGVNIGNPYYPSTLYDALVRYNARKKRGVTILRGRDY